MGIQGLAAGKARVVAVRDTITQFEAATDSAKKELARGSVADVRKRLETYRSSLLAASAPGAGAERGSQSAGRYLDPEQDPRGDAFPGGSPGGRGRARTVRYLLIPMSVIGRYDQIGQFLADVASLQRIIVPYDLSVAAANASSAKALGDTTGSLLEARFQVRTL